MKRSLAAGCAALALALASAQDGRADEALAFRGPVVLDNGAPTQSDVAVSAANPLPVSGQVQGGVPSGASTGAQNPVVIGATNQGGNAVQLSGNQNNSDGMSASSTQKFLETMGYGYVFNGSAWDRLRACSAQGCLTVGGNQGSGGADSGNPVKIGGVYSVTKPNVSNGQRVDQQMTQRGYAFVALNDGTGADVPVGAISTFSDGRSNSSSGEGSIFVVSRPLLFNGATWDRAYAANGGAQTGGTGVQLVLAQATTTSNGLTNFHLVSAAGVNATSLKAAAGKIVGGAACNGGTGLKYVKFFNKASAPSLGTDTPVWTLAIGAGACVPVAAAVGDYGLFFSTGIAFAVTNGVADTDASAVASGDVVLNLTFV